MDFLKATTALSIALNESAHREAEADEQERERQTRVIEETIQSLQGDTALQATLICLQTDDVIGADDVMTFWQTLQEHVPVTPQNRGIYQHLADSALFAVHLARLFPEYEIRSEKAAMTAILHNAGMLVGPSVEYYRKAEVTFLLAERLGIHQNIQKLFLPLTLYITPKNEGETPRIPTTESPEDPVILENADYILRTITPEQLMMEMARVFAKRNKSTGKLLSWHEVMDGHLKTRKGEAGYRTVIGGKKILWPSAKEALQDIEASRLAESYGEVYLQALNALAKRGFDHQAIATEIDNAGDTDDRLEAVVQLLFTEYLPLD